MLKLNLFVKLSNIFVLITVIVKDNKIDYNISKKYFI